MTLGDRDAHQQQWLAAPSPPTVQLSPRQRLQRDAWHRAISYALLAIPAAGMLLGS